MQHLHLGSGSHYYAGWLNVDVDPMWHPDLVCDAQHLTSYFPKGEFDMVYLGHVLEHLEYESIPQIMSQIAAVCAPGAKLAVVGPDMDRAVAQRQPQQLLDAIKADYKPPGGHAWTATGDLTRAILERCAVLEDVKEVPVAEIHRPDWPNPVIAGWQCAFTATII